MQLAGIYRCLLAMTLFAACRVSTASCEDGHPSVQKEFRGSKVVLLGSVTSSRDVSSPDDPSGVDFVIYSLKVERSFKGKVARVIKVSSENTTSRFPMDIGKSYLVFLYNDGDGYFVDNCGNSGEEQDSTGAIQEVEHLRMSRTKAYK